MNTPPVEEPNTYGDPKPYGNRAERRQGEREQRQQQAPRDRQMRPRRNR